MSRFSDGVASPSRTSAAARELHLVTFLLDEWEYAIEVTDVCGIYHGLAIIPTPDEPEIFAGEVYLSTGRVPIVNLRQLLHLPELATPGWLLMTNYADNPIGILVDRVSEVIRLQPHALEPLPEGNGHVPAGDYLTAVAYHQNRTIHLPDLPRLLHECKR